jgi:hypothetical protein
MGLGCHQINDPTTTRKSTEILIEAGTTAEIDTDNACSLGLHFTWLDGSLESYISKWLDTETGEVLETAGSSGTKSTIRSFTAPAKASWAAS